MVARQALTRSLASAPNTRSASPARAVMPPLLRDQSVAPRAASAQPMAFWKARMQTRSPTRTMGPTRSARRSTSLLPRGVARAASHCTVPRSGSTPARRGPWATSSVLRKLPMTLGWARVSGSFGRCSTQRRRPSRASKACTARSTPSTNTRSPATRGGVTTLAGSRARQTSRPRSSVTTSLSRVTTAVKRPSWPTPAESCAPTGQRHQSSPVSALKACTSPHDDATTTSPSRTAGVSGKSTRPMPACQTMRPAILGTRGSSGLGGGASDAHPTRKDSASSAANPARRLTWRLPVRVRWPPRRRPPARPAPRAWPRRSGGSRRGRPSPRARAGRR